MNNNYLANAYTNFYKIPQLRLEKTEKINPNYQIIGLYDKIQNIWYNAWGLYNPESNYNLYRKSKELLQYALNIERDLKGISPAIKSIIRYILTSSKIYITERKTQLDLILALIMYMIKPKVWGWIKLGSNEICIVEF